MRFKHERKMSMLGDGDAGTVVSGDAPPATTATIDAPPVETAAAPEWLSAFEGIDESIYSDTSLKAIKDVPALVKSYVNGQRMLGADKAVIPTVNSTDEERLSFYHKMGLPTDFGEYSVAEGEKAILKEDMREAFRQTAYDNKLMPEQAQAMFDFLENHTGTELERMENGSKEKLEADIGGLKAEWGEAFEQNVHTAKLAVAEFGGEDLKTYLNESGLGNDPAIIKVFSEIGKQFFKEDSFGGKGKPAYGLSPADAQKKVGEITGDMNGPYYNSMHPDHARIVKEVNKMYEVMSKKA